MERRKRRDKQGIKSGNRDEAIKVTKDEKKSAHKYIGKAGSSAYLKAVEMLVRRTKIEGLALLPSYSGTGIVGWVLKKGRDIIWIESKLADNNR